MRNSSRRGPLIGALCLLIVGVVLLQYQIDPLRRQPGIEPPSARRALGGIGRTGAALPFEYTLGAVSGFRQVIAGLLWVRADAFFHQGNYDAILPLVRIITWMDPNFIDVYSTGAWHLMYNFTDESQRSDRRYLPAGMALLNEGITSNPNTYDLYAEAGWNSFDKIKNYDESIRYYRGALETPNVDYTRVGHPLAHALERAGRIDEAIKEWDEVLAEHERILNDPKASEDQKMRARTGVESARRNLNLLKIRRVARVDDVKPPIDARFTVKVVRVKPKVLEISGSWNAVGAKNFDQYDQRIWGPVDGARVDVRLQDAGYKMPTEKEFSFDVDPNLTIMQDALSTTKGKKVDAGGLYIVTPGITAVNPPQAEKEAIYSFGDKEEPAGLGVPLKTAIAQNTPLSADGRRQLVAMAKAFAQRDISAQNPLADLKGDAAALAALDKAGIHVATKNYYSLGKFKREIDMSQDPRMYSFTNDKYDLIISFNPRTAPDMVQDRLGWNGEGLTDKNVLDTTSQPGVRMLKKTFTLTREDILGQGRKVLKEMVAG